MKGSNKNNNRKKSMAFCFAKSTIDVILKSKLQQSFKQYLFCWYSGFFNVKILFDRSYSDLNNCYIFFNNKPYPP